jgi:hypothetical protein
MNEQQYFNWDTIKTSRTINQQPAGTGTVAGTKISDSDFANFIKLLADKVGFKLTDQNIRFLQSWRKAEGTNASNNPFATTLNYSKDPNMTKFNLASKGQGVKNFSTVEFGADATAITILLPYYTSLVTKLKNPNSTAEELATDPSLRKWGTTSSNPNLILSLIPGAKLTVDIDDATSTVSKLDDIIAANEIVLEAWNNMHDVFTKNPDKYFSKYSGLLNDQEQAAARWLRVAFRDGWMKNIKNPDKSLEKIRVEMLNNGSKEAKYVVDNIQSLYAIYRTIYTWILNGNQGRIKDGASVFKYYDIKLKNWYSKQFNFKWNYM